MTPRSLAAKRTSVRSLIAVGAIILAVGQAHAQIGVPAPSTSTCPLAVTVRSDGTCCFRVVVRDIAANPIAGSRVVVDFGTCAVNFCPTQPDPGMTVVGNTVAKFTDGSGEARFCICASFTPPCTARIYADGVLLCSVPMEITCCRSNLVSNGDFTAGLVFGSMPPASVTDWSLLSGTPQVISGGCEDVGAVQMWGNNVVGESIMQALPGVGIEAGGLYSVTVCYRWLDNNPILPQHVQFRLAVSGTPPTDYPPVPPYATIGVTPLTSSTSWTTYTFPLWTAPINAGWLTVNPENGEMLDDPDFVSWGIIDDICIERVIIVPTEKGSWGRLKAIYR